MPTNRMPHLGAGGLGVLALLAVAAVVVGGAASAFATVRQLLWEPYPHGRVTRTVDGIRFSFVVPGRDRWMNGPIERTGDTPDTARSRNFLISRSTVGGQAAEAVIFWTVFPDGGQPALCTKLLSRVGPSTADLAAAIAHAPGTRVVKGPRRVTLGGRPAQHVALRVRRDRGCDPGYFFTWRDQQWGAFWPGTKAGDAISMWIVDVDGTRLVIEAETEQPESQRPPTWLSPRVTRADVLEVEREIVSIVESIRFD